MRRSGESARANRRENGPRGSDGNRFGVSAAVLIAVAVGLLGVGFYVGKAFITAAGTRVLESAPVVGGALPASAASSATVAVVSDGSIGLVEVPAVGGMTVAEAVATLEAAGLRVELIDSGETVATAAERLVMTQRPAGATVLSTGASVTLVAPAQTSDETTAATAPARASRKGTVCIDPGHQAHSEVKLEPIGPGSRREKPRATGGATGVATGVPEHEVALQLAMNLKERLESEGYRVVLTRTTNDVLLSNAQRARIANRAHADLFVRIHCGASTVATVSGVQTFYPARNRWTGPIAATSRRAAVLIGNALAASTGAVRLGAHAQDGMAGFNWSKVPVVSVETGYLSNPTEDRLLSSPSHQDKVAEGIASGIVAYLDRERR